MGQAINKITELQELNQKLVNALTAIANQSVEDAEAPGAGTKCKELAGQVLNLK